MKGVRTPIPSLVLCEFIIVLSFRLSTKKNLIQAFKENIFRLLYKEKNSIIFLPNQCPHLNSPYLHFGLFSNGLMVFGNKRNWSIHCICSPGVTKNISLWIGFCNIISFLFIKNYPYFGCKIFIFGHKMGSKRDSLVNVLSSWLRNRSMKVKIFLGILLAFCAVVALKLTITDLEFFYIASNTIHIVGLIALIYKLFVHKSCSGKFLNFSSLIGHCLYFFSVRNEPLHWSIRSRDK